MWFSVFLSPFDPKVSSLWLPWKESVFFLWFYVEEALWIDQWPSIRWLLMNEMRVGGRVSEVLLSSAEFLSPGLTASSPRPLHHYLSSHYQLLSSETPCTLYTFLGEGGCTCRGLDLLCVCVPHARKWEVMLQRQVATEASRYPFCVIVVISRWQLCVCAVVLLLQDGKKRQVVQWLTHAGNVGLKPADNNYLSYSFSLLLSTIFFNKKVNI